MTSTPPAGLLWHLGAGRQGDRYLKTLGDKSTGDASALLFWIGQREAGWGLGGWRGMGGGGERGHL